MSERPFRHLCPEADLRDAMSDDEFWEHVFRASPQWDDDDAGPDLDVVSMQAPPCVTCGATGACGWDSEGRALIHVTGEDDS